MSVAYQNPTRSRGREGRNGRRQKGSLSQYHERKTNRSSNTPRMHARVSSDPIVRTQSKNPRNRCRYFSLDGSVKPNAWRDWEIASFHQSGLLEISKNQRGGALPPYDFLTIPQLTDKVQPRVFESDKPENEIANPMDWKSKTPVPLPSIAPNISFQVGTQSLPIYETSATMPTRIPELMDSTVVTWNESGGEIDQYALFRRELSKLKQKRLDVLSFRSEIRKYRGELREKQNLKARADDRLLRRIRVDEMKIRSDDLPPEWRHKTIVELSQECQDARDDYGPSEFECDEREDQLSYAEFELDREESLFYERWDIRPNLRQRNSDMPSVTSPIAPSIEYDDGDGDQFPYHPLVTKYLSRKGDLENLREQLDDLEEERESLKELKRVRMLGNIPLGLNEQAELDEIVMSIPRLLIEIENTRNTVRDLREQCLEMALVDEDGEPVDTDSQNWKKLRRGSDIDSGSELSIYSKFPTLLAQPEVKRIDSLRTISREEEVQHTNLEPLNMSTLQAFQSTVEPKTSVQISNDWMLQRLQISPREVNHLASISKDRGENIGPVWEVQVLQCWNSDYGEVPTASMVLSCSSLTTQAPRRAEKLGNIQRSLGSFPVQQHFSSERALRCRDSNGSGMTEIEDTIGLTSSGTLKVVPSWESR